MSVTIIYENRVPLDVASATAEGDNLWLTAADLVRATGWELKPQGACLGDRCVPIPSNRAAEFQRLDGGFNLAALARQIGQAYVANERLGVWSFAQAPEAIGGKLHS